MKLISLDKYSFVFVHDDATEEDIKEFYRLLYGHMIEHFIEKTDRIETQPTIEQDETH